MTVSSRGWRSAPRDLTVALMGPFSRKNDAETFREILAVYAGSG